MKFATFLKNVFVKHIPLKLLAIVLAVAVAIVISVTYSVSEPASQPEASAPCTGAVEYTAAV